MTLTLIGLCLMSLSYITIFSSFKLIDPLFLAHLWEAYAIHMALCGIRRTSCILCRVSSVS